MSNKLVIVIFKNTKLKAFMSSIYPGTIPDNSAFIQQAVDIHGGITADYLALQITDSLTIQRLQQDDEFIGTVESGVFTAIDFTPEDTKKWLQMSTDDPNNEVRLYRNGSCDTLNVTGQILIADKSAVDTTFNETISINIIDPDKNEVPMKAEFVNGIHTERFYPIKYGTYIIPECEIRCYDGTLRVVEQLKIKVYYQSI